MDTMNTELTARLDATDAKLIERADALFLDLKQLRPQLYAKVQFHLAVNHGPLNLLGKFTHGMNTEQN